VAVTKRRQFVVHSVAHLPWRIVSLASCTLRRSDRAKDNVNDEANGAACRGFWESCWQTASSGSTVWLTILATRIPSVAHATPSASSTPDSRAAATPRAATPCDLTTRTPGGRLGRETGEWPVRTKPGGCSQSAPGSPRQHPRVILATLASVRCGTGIPSRTGPRMVRVLQHREGLFGAGRAFRCRAVVRNSQLPAQEAAP